jgi:peroxiredoxin Q/BCP
MAVVEVADGMPAVGSAAPAFALQGDDGRTHTLAAHEGRHVVLYFYPRDNTPGCTLEARDFSRLAEAFSRRNAVVFGVSTDSVSSHAKFKSKCELDVTLLADPDKAAHEAYGAWREKVMYGRKMMGTQRSTFLIGPDGVVRRVWPKVKVDGHADDVLSALG